jgi:hypothetical protein
MYKKIYFVLSYASPLLYGYVSVYRNCLQVCSVMSATGIFVMFYLFRQVRPKTLRRCRRLVLERIGFL